MVFTLSSNYKPADFHSELQIMDPPQIPISSRWRSSKINSILSPLQRTSTSPAPRNASTWDSIPGLSHFLMASDIVGRRPSETDSYSTSQSSQVLGIPNIGNIATRNASAWDANTAMISSVIPFFNTSASPAPRNASTWDYATHSTSQASEYSDADNIATRHASERDTNTVNHNAGNIATRAWNSTVTMNRGTRSSVLSVISPQKAKILHHKRWDAYGVALRENDDETYWGCMAKVIAMDSAGDALPLEKNIFYAGNIDYICKHHEGKRLAMADIEAIMYVYGVENTTALGIVKKLDPEKRGIFDVNTQNKLILLASTMKFSDVKEPELCKLRHASKCLQDNLLSPIYFACYIIEVLEEKYLGGEPGFLILGMYGILGVLEGTTNRRLTIKDVELFARLWNVNTNSIEVQELVKEIKDCYNGTITCSDFYTLLYHRNVYGKEHIQMFDTLGQQSPSMFFPLLDKDGDGFLSSADLRSFAAIFGRYPSDEAIERVTRKLDMDGDGMISLVDFHEAMEPILDGLTWDFWLVAILITLKL